MSLVTVICPGARRCNIKVTPNTLLLQILEQACSKQKLDPSLYALKHHRHVLDLSLTLRYSGLPNNAKLEMVEAESQRREDGDVMVAVQTADGTRVQSTFHSSTSLWDVLCQHKFDSSPDGTEPSLMYMRQEVWGEVALRQKTLRDVGLSSGRGGVLRLTHRKASAAVGVSTGGEEGGEVKLKAEQPLPVLSGRILSAETGQRDRKEEKEKEEEEKEEEEKKEEEKKEEEKEKEKKERGEEPRLKPQHSRPEPMDTVEEQLPYFPAHPISYFPTPDIENENLLSEIEEPLETKEEEAAAGSSPHSSPMVLDTNTVTAASLIQQAMQQQQHSHSLPPDVVAAQLEELQTSPFAEFAGLSRPHPLATPIFPPKPKAYDEPCERDLVVYHLDNSLQLTPTEEVPDSFFQHNVTDLQVLHSNLKRGAKTSDAPLMTQAMRTVRDEMKLEKYTKGIVRVYFMDRWVLQGCFRPQESLKALVVFVRENLADPQVKFHLYTTPPKRVLTSARITFVEAGLLPTAVVYVGVEEGRPHPQLSDSALQRAASALQAELVHTTQRKAHTQETTSPLGQRSSSQHLPRDTTKSRQTSATPTTSQAGRKVPKWFRTGQRRWKLWLASVTIYAFAGH